MPHFSPVLREVGFQKMGQKFAEALLLFNPKDRPFRNRG